MSDARQLYLEYRQLSEQLRATEQFLQETTENIHEVKSVIEAITEVGKLKKGAHLQSPIANGIFVETTLEDAATLRMNVGGGVIVKKSVAEAAALLEGQCAKLEELRQSAAVEYSKTVTEMRSIEEAIHNESSEKEDA